MPIPELVYSDPNVKVYVRGIRETVRALETAGVQAQDLKNIFERAGAVVERAAKVPERTGRLERSVRITKTKNRAAIRAGGKRVPYAVANHFGRSYPTTGNRVEGTFFFKDAVQSKRGQVLNIIVSGLEKLFKKYDLGNPPIRVTSFRTK
jgi:hypothetical protein